MEYLPSLSTLKYGRWKSAYSQLKSWKKLANVRSYSLEPWWLPNLHQNLYVLGHRWPWHRIVRQDTGLSNENDTNQSHKRRLWIGIFGLISDDCVLHPWQTHVKVDPGAIGHWLILGTPSIQGVSFCSSPCQWMLVPSSGPEILLWTVTSELSTDA